jgi:hypothetical protein
MVNANVLKAAGEAFEAHGVTPRTGEKLGDTVARALKLTDSETQRWLEALATGCSVEEANQRAGIASHRTDEVLLVAVARAIGTALGKVVN